jgi:hypothetical protein
MRVPSLAHPAPQTSKTGGCRFESCRPCTRTPCIVQGFSLSDLESDELGTAHW